MPFVKTNMIEKTKELQELFKNNSKTIKESKEHKNIYIETDQVLKPVIAVVTF